VRKRHWWSDLKDVVEWSIRAKQNSLFAHSIHDLVGFDGRGGVAVSQLDAEEQTRAADIADDVVALLQVA